MGVTNYYSACYEPWQDGLAEASIKSTIMLAKCGVADSGLGSPFWFSAATNRKDAGMQRTSMESGIPHTVFYMVKRRTSPSADRSDAEDMCTCLRLGVRRKKAPRAVEGVDSGFASNRNTSAYKLYIQSTRQIIVTNQVVFDESFIPYSKEELIKHLDEGDDELDILYKSV
jgi:hypothetical protein